VFALNPLTPHRRAPLEQAAEDTPQSVLFGHHGRVSDRDIAQTTNDLLVLNGSTASRAKKTT